MTDSWLPTSKHCSCCGAWLPLASFPANRRMHLGVSSRCRECHRLATADWRRRNRDVVNAARRAEYRREHPVPTRACIVCGELFAKRADALVCSERCRNTRRREQRKANSSRRLRGRGGNATNVPNNPA
jgi:predicted nucleic acid-binding Zn ribbon protein